MTLRAVSRTSAGRIALGALTLSMLVLLWAIVRAVRPEPLPPTPATTLVSLSSIVRPQPAPVADVDAAVEHDVFASDRAASSVPYRMPGETADSDAPAVVPDKPAVLGTVVATDGRSFATVQLGGAKPTLVHVGDRIGAWTVRIIERGKVTLVSTGGVRVDVVVPKPGI